MLKMNLNVETLKGLSNKEIASALKKELKTQLKGVKFSVTSSIYSINCQCPEADFEANKEVIKEVAGMCSKYADTIYINNRIASYFDTKEYKEQQQKEYELQQIELEEERQERENLYNNNVAIKEFNNNNVKVVSVENKNIFVTALEPALNKNDWKSDNDKCIDEKSYLNKYKITDIVYMNEENYNYFCFNLLSDYDFLKGKGGTWSDDKTGIVEYNCAVCVYCEGKEPIIVDPQGYSYARYTNRLTEDINGDLQKELNTELNINNKSFNQTFNSISTVDLYIYSNNTWSYLENKIVNDNRFIYDDYTANVIITGLTYKELLQDGNGIKLNLEKLHYNYETLAKNIIKCENGEVKVIFGKSKLETVFNGIKFSERLLKELKRATEQPTPEPPKPTKKQNINNDTEVKQDKNNIVVVDFTQKQTVKAEWKQDQATNKQLYALYCITKIKTTGLKISKGEASTLIGKAKKGVDIKEDLKQLISNQNLSIAK